MRHNKWLFASRRHRKQSEQADQTPTELSLGTCYVKVGGYGTVEIRAVYEGNIQGKSVRIALPCQTDGAGEGECVLQPTDTIAIHGVHGEIARIPVQEVITHGSYAGFRLLTDSTPENASEISSHDALQAFEQYLAGVSARALREKERQERTGL